MASKSFRCPKCGFSTSFGQLLGPDARRTVPLHTHIAGGGAAPAPGGKTHVATPGMASRGLVTLNVPKSGRTFPVGQGVYTLGRESSDSRATLRIAPDPYMSRLQARLEVMATPQGVSCRIIGLNSANPVFVNNRQINPNFGVDLKNGDKLLLGMTEVTVAM